MPNFFYKESQHNVRFTFSAADTTWAITLSKKNRIGDTKYNSLV